MKKGDNVFCKKDFDGYENQKVGFITIGKCYKIENISKYQNPSYNNTYIIILIRGDNGSGEWFTPQNINGELYIWDFFYSNKEIRKMKLNKIESNL